ncbi:MAG TPA: AAA family ATPase [Patescibacteria group bacterium]|nr:AAA family ATPase [Patescibacteria group bacterium]
MVPITGRDVERSLIASVIDRARTGSSAGLVLVGPAGAGKSRLLRDVPDGPLRRLDIVGYEPESAIQFAAIGALLVELGIGDLRQAASSGDAGTSSEPLRVFESVFAAIAGGGPTVLVVDDLQWLDASSAALLHYLVRGSMATHPAMALIVATRPGPEAAPRIEALERLFGDRGGLVVRELDPLTEAESIALVRAAAPGLTDVAATRIWRRVGGSPYWLLAVARAPDEDPALALRSRLDRLSSDSVTALGVLAVAGRPTEKRTVARVLGWPDERFDGVVRDLLRAGLIRADVNGLRPVHDLVREAVAADLPDRTRRAHHARLAGIVESEARGDVAELAVALDHTIAAGEPAIELGLRLASAPGRRLLGADGLGVLDRVIDASRPSAPGRDRLRLDVARLATELGASPIAFARWRELADDGPADVRLEARLAAANEAYRLGRADDMHALIGDLDAGDDELIVVEARRLQAQSLLWLESRFEDGRARAADVIARARSLAAGLTGDEPDDRRQRVGAAYRAALKVAFEAAMQAEQWQEQFVLAKELVDASRDLGGRAHVEALLFDGMAHRYIGDRQTSVERYRLAHAMATREVLPDQVVEAGTFLASTLESLGELEEALAVGLATAELAERVGAYSRLRARPRTIVPEIRLSLGPWREALVAIEADADGLDPHYRLTLWQIAASAVSRIQGAPAVDRIRRMVEASLADAERAGCPRCRREAQLVNAVSLARVGRAADARALLESAESGIPEVPLEPYVADMREWATALLSGADDGGSDRLVDVIDRNRRTGRRIDAIWATIDLGRALIGTDPVRSARVLRQAGIEAEGLGARTQAQVADRLLRGLGQRTWRRGAAGSGPLELTEREREVAAQVAAGASNLEIADSLFVSIKTVERHVSNLFAKYGVRNRTELARSWSADRAGDRDV